MKTEQKLTNLENYPSNCSAIRGSESLASDDVARMSERLQDRTYCSLPSNSCSSLQQRTLDRQLLPVFPKAILHTIMDGTTPVRKNLWNTEAHSCTKSHFILSCFMQPGPGILLFFCPLLKRQPYTYLDSVNTPLPLPPPPHTMTPGLL